MFVFGPEVVFVTVIVIDVPMFVLVHDAVEMPMRMGMFVVAVIVVVVVVVRRFLHRTIFGFPRSGPFLRERRHENDAPARVMNAWVFGASLDTV